MWRGKILTGGVIVIGFLFLIFMAYKQAFLMTHIHAQLIHLNVLRFTQKLTQTGMNPAQIKVLRSVLLDMNRSTSIYVYGEILNLIGIFSMMGIIFMGFTLLLVGRTPSQKKEDNTQKKA